VAIFNFNLNDAVFLAKVVDFVVLIGAVTFLYQKWGRPWLESEQEKQNKQVEDAETQRQTAAELVVQRQQELEQAKADASRMLQVVLAQAERTVSSQESAAKEHAQRTIAHARGELDRERYRARQELLLDTVDRSYRRSKEIARTEIDPAKQALLVEAAVDALEARRSA
jgi:F-type H+-transporting ATPase subunit b